jgi:hypothetical protein
VHMLVILAINFMRVGNCDLRQQCWFFVFLLSLLIRQYNFVFSALCTIKQVCQFQGQGLLKQKIWKDNAE